jgi:signal transduction histidine kinase
VAATLKQRFMLATLLVYLVTAAASYAALAWIAESIIGNLGTAFAEKQVQYSRAQSLSPLLREVALARKMADTPLLREWAAAEDDPDLRRRALAEMESYRRAFRDGSYFFAVHASGNYYFNDSQGSYAGNEKRYVLDPAAPADDWYFATIRRPQDTQINVNPDAHLKVTKVWVNVTMREGERVLGVLGTGIDLTSFIRGSVDGAQPGIENIFIDGSGAIQAHRDVSLIDFASLTKDPTQQATIFRLVDDESGRRSLAEAMRRLERDADGVETLFVAVDGHRHLVGLSHLSEIGWFAVTLIDLDVLMRQGRFLSVAILIGTALLAALLLTAVLFNRLVLDRVRRLESSARRIAANDYAVQLEAGPDDEIGRLTETFKRMAGMIRDYTATLESRVKAATAEYESANRKLAAQARKLIESNAELEQFSYVVSHDLRQPLRMVSGYLGLIQRKFADADDEELRTFLGFAVDGSKRMDRLIVDLLEYSRTGRSGMPLAPTSLQDVVTESLCYLGPMVADARADIMVADGLPEILGNRDELIRLFENLIGNAIKYRSPDRVPRIRIECRDGGDVWEILIRDNGIGIPADDIDRIFMVFQRSSGAGGCEGSGIGLSVCRKIVEHHGGHIRVESTVGQGSCFRLDFPRPPVAG